MHHLGGLYLPQRRTGRILAAELARTEHARFQDRLVAAGADAGRCGQAAAVGKQNPNVADESFAQIAGQLGEIREYDMAVGIEQRNIARGGDHVGSHVVGHAVRQHDLLVARQLDIARRDDDAQILVVGDLIGGDQHREAWIALLCRCGHRRKAGQEARRQRGGKPPPGSHDAHVAPGSHPRGLSVFQMQQDGNAEHQRHAGWCPGGQDDRNGARQAQRKHDVRHEVEQKAG